jgi:hypothetical protein
MGLRSDWDRAVLDASEYKPIPAYIATALLLGPAPKSCAL